VPPSGGKVATRMRFRAWDIVTRAVEEGLSYGIGRLFKHEDGPFTEAQLRERQDTLVLAIQNALSEVIDFDPEP
jgi:hypothetical protein